MNYTGKFCLKKNFEFYHKLLNQRLDSFEFVMRNSPYVGFFSSIFFIDEFCCTFGNFTCCSDTFPLFKLFDIFFGGFTKLLAFFSAGFSSFFGF